MSNEMGLIRAPQITIANGAAVSNAIDIGELGLCAIVTPSTWTAANLTFQGSVDGVTFFDVYDSSGTELQITAAASRHIMLSPANFAGIRFLKVRSGTTGTPVNQGGDRVLIPLARKLA